MIYIICLLSFGLILFFIRGLFYKISGAETYYERLKSLEELKEKPDNKSKKNLFFTFQAVFNKMSKFFASRSFADKLQVDLVRAGIPLRGEEYITICIGIIIIFPIATFLLTKNIWMAVIAFILGVFVPRLYLKHKMEARLQAINHQLADALVVMANALRAGFGFQQAMDTVKNELPPPISTEFAWTLREMNLGFGHEEALLNLSERVRSDDLDMVITGIIIQRQVGGNLAQILDNISGTMRDRAKIKREIKILTAQGRLSGLIIGLLPVILVAAMLAINPAYFNVMLTDIRGIIVMAVAILLELLGVIIIKQITNIDL